MIGTKLAQYEITSHLGSGGMGDVYQATDLKLGRSVAIKFLPEAFSHDNDRVARFDREARILASLNHPHIAGIYGLEESAERKFLVMELVEGETLAERIKRGPIPVEESLQIAMQICEALEAAHEKGVIHRDLKPANVKVTTDGKVKVLDFGLAKAYEGETSAVLSQSPTLSMAATNAGVILGTAAYMSPEQAKGRTVDKRTDIFAFGCVLYEMLAGRPAFDGEDVQDILGAVLKSEPDWTRLPIEVLPLISRLLRLCLQKDAKKRRQTATDVRIDIELALAEPVAPAATRARSGRRGWIASLAVAAVLIVAMAVPTARYLLEATPPSRPEMRLEVTTPPTTSPASIAISPDGQKIVFAATAEGGSRLWLRALDAVSARPLAGTDGGTNPFWSPDSRSIGFFADARLRRIDIDGGTARPLASAINGRGGDWNRDGTILFAPSGVSSLFSISATTGGEPAAVTRLTAPQQGNHGFPQFLPDGRHFLYSVQGNSDIHGVYIGQLGGSEARHLLDADTSALYVSSGQLLFVSQGTLFAQNFDPVHMELSGNPSPVAERVAVDRSYAAAVSASAAGTIVYRSGSSGGQRQFIWFDRSGNETGRVGDPVSPGPMNPSMSPDGRHVALYRNLNGNADIWLLETGRGVLNRFTTDAAVEQAPIWSPDGTRIVFSSSRNGIGDLYVKLATGAGNEEKLLATPQSKMAVDWSPDGHFILYDTLDPKTGSWELWVFPLDGARQSYPVARTESDVKDGQFSPDGKWIAYQSNESGRSEIYVQPFPGPGGKMQMSTTGGAQVRWRRDGKELFYIALDDRLMAVPIQVAANGKTVEPGSPIPLFITRVGGALQTIYRQQYMVSPDGQRFLMNALTEEATSPITVILNWKRPAK